jgi:glycosyltransferase involved in cell wall biosynthesis
VRYVRDNLLRRPIDRRLEHLLGQLNRAQLCLSPSQFLLAEYQRHGLREPQCEHSENGVEVDWAQSLTPRTQRSQRLRFGFIGSFLPSKGVDLLVQAFQDIAPGEAELHLYGTSLWDGGRFANRVERSNRHPDVHFHGAFAHDQLAKVLDFLDVLVVPSRWFENAPLTLDEAALAERPVIGSDHGGLREIILRRGNGLLFRPGDAPSLLQSLRRFIDEPALWEKLRRSKLPVRTVAQQASELLEHYQRLLHLGQT